MPNQGDPDSTEVIVLRRYVAFAVLVLVALGLAGTLVVGARAPRNVGWVHRGLTQVPTIAVVASALPPVPSSKQHEEPPEAEACSRSMRLIQGEYCSFVAHRCDKQAGPVCERYLPEVLCEGSLFALRYCIDEFEYPNLRGVLPATFVSYDDARRACAAEEKRLCTAPEWQLACEGPSRTPYVNGLVRDETCNTDRPDPKGQLLDDPFEVALELDRLDGRLPAGSASGCTTRAHVADLGGNLAEWVENPDGGSRGPPFRSARAGGAFGSGPSTCRTLITDAAPTSRSHRVGFRCCSDAAQSGQAASVRLRSKPRSGFERIQLSHP